MPRTTTLLMVIVLVIGSVSAFPMAAAAQSGSIAPAISTSTHAQVDENASDVAKNVTSGERLSAVVGVVEAEFEGEVEQRAYGIAYARAATDGEKAQVVAERLTDIEQRLEEFHEERERLIEAHQNGELSDGEFQARMAELAARMGTADQMTEASEARADDLPASVLRDNGVNVSAIQELKMYSEELSGGQVAAIAQSISGPDTGQSVSQGPAAQVGIPGPDQARDGDGGDAEAAIDRAEERLNATQMTLEEVEDRVNDTDASDDATDAIASAKMELEHARDALDDARAAMDAGNADEAASLVEDAMSHVEQAESDLQDALQAVQTSSGDGQPS